MKDTTSLPLTSTSNKIRTALTHTRQPTPGANTPASLHYRVRELLRAEAIKTAVSCGDGWFGQNSTYTKLQEKYSHLTGQHANIIDELRARNPDLTFEQAALAAEDTLAKTPLQLRRQAN